MTSEVYLCTECGAETDIPVGNVHPHWVLCKRCEKALALSHDELEERYLYLPSRQRPANVRVTPKSDVTVIVESNGYTHLVGLVSCCGFIRDEANMMHECCGIFWLKPGSMDNAYCPRCERLLVD